MNCSLPGLPIEVLSIITSHFPSLNEALPLFLTGNSALLAKLYAGGFTSILIDDWGVTRGAVKFLTTCRLFSATLVFAEQPSEELQDLFEALPPTLHHLTLTTNDLAPLLTSQELNLNSRPSRLLSSAFRPWQVSQSFPNLESLTLNDKTGESFRDLPFDAQFWHDFIAGLPPSLGCLHMPRVPPSCWSALPPHLTSLRRVNGATHSLPPTLLHSLIDLSITIRSPGDTIDELMASIKRLGDDIDIIPKNLTRLKLSSHELLQDDAYLPHQAIGTPKFGLPLTLTSLTWSSHSEYTMSPLRTLLAYLPPTIRELELKKFTFSIRSLFGSHTSPSSASTSRPTHADDNTADTINCSNYTGPVFVHLKKAVFHLCRFRFLSTTPSDSEPPLRVATYSFIFRSMPNLEHLVMEPADKPKDGEQLSYPRLLLNYFILDDSTPVKAWGHNLKTLKAPLDISVLEPSSPPTHQVDASSLAQLPTTLAHLAPHLVKIALTHNRGLTYTLSSERFWSSLPRSLTSLDLGKVVHCTQSVASRMPPSLTEFKGTINLDSDSESLHRLFYAPDNHKMDKSEPEEGYELSTAIYRRLVRIKDEDKSEYDDRHFWLAPSLENTDIDVWWPNEVDYGANLTSLSVYADFSETFATVFEQEFNPYLYPLLERLKLHFNFPGKLDLGVLKELRSLEIGDFLCESDSTCPPKLTRLKGGKLHLPDAFLPLPSTMTELVFTESLEPFDKIVEFLPVLESFGSNFELREGHSTLKQLYDWALQPHPTIKSLWLPNIGKNEKVVSSLSSCFPSLQRIFLTGGLSSDDAFNLIKHLPSPNIVIEGCSIEYFSDLADLATRAGITPGSIRPLRNMSFGHWSYAAMANAAPQMRDLVASIRYRFDSLSWPKFTQFLAPDLQHLCMMHHETIPSDFSASLPRKLISLSIVSEGLYDFSDLPQTIRTMSIQKTKITPEMIGALPRELTNLALPSAMLSLEHIKALPPSLIQLRFSPMAPPEASMFEALPQTQLVLFALQSPKAPLTTAIMDALPPSVRFFEGFADRESAKRLIRAHKFEASNPLDSTPPGYLSWVAPHSVHSIATLILEDEPNVVIAPGRKDNFVIRTQAWM